MRSFGSLANLGVVLLMLLALGCQPDEMDIRIVGTNPEPVQQTKTLWIFGSGFGEFEDGLAGVMVGTTCADVLSWEEDRIAVQVPAGIGVGVRRLGVYRVDGAYAAADIEINGDNLVGVANPACNFAPIVFGDPSPRDTFTLPDTQDTTDAPDDDTPQPDTSDVPPDSPDTPDVPPDTRDTQDVPPDTIGPDVPPDTWNETWEDTWDTSDTGDEDIWWNCPIAIYEGACTNPNDCQILTSQGLFMGDIVYMCVQQCVGFPEERQCTQQCIRQSSGLQPECARCHTQYGFCAVSNCLNECLPDVYSDECWECRLIFCAERFEQCSGVFGDMW